jgi:hypothetical protein
LYKIIYYLYNNYYNNNLYTCTDLKDGLHVSCIFLSNIFLYSYFLEEETLTHIVENIYSRRLNYLMIYDKILYVLWKIRYFVYFNDYFMGRPNYIL